MLQSDAPHRFHCGKLPLQHGNGVARSSRHIITAATVHADEMSGTMPLDHVQWENPFEVLLCASRYAASCNSQHLKRCWAALMLSSQDVLTGMKSTHLHHHKNAGLTHPEANLPQSAPHADCQVQTSSRSIRCERHGDCRESSQTSAKAAPYLRLTFCMLTKDHHARLIIAAC